MILKYEFEFESQLCNLQMVVVECALVCYAPLCVQYAATFSPNLQYIVL